MEKVINKNEVAIGIKGLYKKYVGNKKYSIKDLSFEVRKGQFHGFIGANGAGKTTTIKSIIGAYASYKGNISIFGFKHSTIEGKKKIGYIPEEAKFPSEFSTYGYIKHMCHIQGMSWKDSKNNALRIINDIGLKKFMRKNPNKLSSGQKKKVLLAQALVHDPEVLIMDEPAANLDPNTRKDFFDSLKVLKNQGKAIFISSHILSELDEYVDSATILDEGEVIFTGELLAIRTQKDLYTINVDSKYQASIKKFTTINNINFKLHHKNIMLKLTDDNYLKLLSFLKTNKIIINNLSKYKFSLQEIYNSYINDVKKIQRGNNE